MLNDGNANKPASHRFIGEIDGWDSWGKIFQSKEAFRGIVREILRRSGLDGGLEIEGLTPGTNAVFKTGCHVLKIFAPPESGIESPDDFQNEIRAMRCAARRGVASPHITRTGIVRDKYDFKYIVMDYIEGAEAVEIIPGLDTRGKKKFVHEIKTILSKLNKPYRARVCSPDLSRRALNSRLDGLSPEFVKDIAEHAASLDFSRRVLTHGDITGDNIIVGQNVEISVLDFADAVLAPAYYELPPLAFDLFRADRELICEFAGDAGLEVFVDELIKGLVIHDFCGGILKDFYRRFGIETGAIGSIGELRELLIDIWAAR